MASKVREFVEALPAELDTLRASVAATARPELLPLDLSYESLDRVEDFFTLVLDGHAREDDARLASYIGATLVERAGGKWASSTNLEARDLPVVKSLPFLGTFVVFPMKPVTAYRNFRVAGHLRDATERYDLPRVRAQVAELLGSVDAEIDALRAEVGELLERDPGPLDRSLGSVEAIDAALRRLIDAGAPRDQVRRVRRRAGLYLGTVLQHALGGGDWLLDEDPRSMYYAQPTTHGWAPMEIVRGTGPRRPPGFLASLVERAIATRSTRT